MNKISSKLDWTMMLGFEQIASDRAALNGGSLGGKTGAKIGGKVGGKIGTKPYTGDFKQK